jgi:SagB-type dehydrogenase family enzyme
MLQAGQITTAARKIWLRSTVTFRPQVSVTAEADTVTARGPSAGVTVRCAGAGVVATALRRLTSGPVAVSDLVAGLSTPEADALHRVLRRLDHLIVHIISFDERELIRIEYTARDTRYHVAEVTADALVRLSRFALCRTRHDAFALESPQSKCRIALSAPEVRALVAALGAPCRVADLDVVALPARVLEEILGHLVGAGLVEIAMASGRFASDEDRTLRQWDFHDLLFHSRIRHGRYDEPSGGTFPYLGEFDPPPPIKEVPDGPRVPLYRPDVALLRHVDVRLTAAVEDRRSIREYSPHPMTVTQLGEFLYRVARVRARHVIDEPTGAELVSRPYPSGGAAYELEFYVTSNRCFGLPQGIYYYDPVRHELVLINDNAGDRASLLFGARLATGVDAIPDVLITLTSRFQRISWKYRSIAYATTLRNTGAVYQTMYLVATAMGLAACGLGNGDADHTARALGTDYLVESSVGEFILGSLPHDVSPGASPEWALESRIVLP